MWVLQGGHTCCDNVVVPVGVVRPPELLEEGQFGVQAGDLV